MGTTADARTRAFLAVAIVVLGARRPVDAQSGGSCAVAGKSPCVIELHGPHAPSLSANCAVEPWSTYVRLMLPDRFVDSNADGWWETVVEIALDPAKDCACAKLRIEFENPVADWSVNIGDSPTNNGLGGDAGTTNYAAEMQIVDGILTMFTIAAPSLATYRADRILEWNFPPLGGRHADVEICDQAIVFDMPGAFTGNRPMHWKLQTPTLGVLYSLVPRAGPAGPAGGKKRDRGIYAGLNRVVQGADKGAQPRIGTGVRRVEITLLP